MPKTLKDFREAEMFTAPDRHGDRFDLVVLGGLTTAAILAIAAFAYVVVRFVH